MAKSADAYIQAPSDTDNSGKKAHTKSKLIGANTVHQHVVVLNHPELVYGIYYGHSGRLTVLETAHAADAGFVWLSNPVASGYSLALRRVELQAIPASAMSTPTAPRVTLERFTFTGVHVGDTISPSKRATTDQGAQARLSANKTGMTVTPGSIMRAFLVPPVLSAVGPGIPNELIWQPSDIEGETVLVPGEGVVVRQADNGTPSDTRVVIVNFTWLEYALT